MQLAAGWNADIWDQEGSRWLRLWPPADIFGEPAGLAEAIWSALGDHRRAVLDLGPVAFMSSSLMGVLVRLHKRFVIGGGILRLAGLRNECRSALHVCRLDSVLELAD